MLARFSKSTSVSFMPGLILETAAAVGDIVVNCSSVSRDVELTGPAQKAREKFTLDEMPPRGLLNQLCTKSVYSLQVTNF